MERTYIVRHWKQGEPVGHSQETQADSPLAAAESVCGRPLRDRGKPGLAVVSVRAKHQPSEQQFFYDPAAD